MIQNQVNVNRADGLGEMPLAKAAYKGFERIAAMLINAGANINYADVAGLSALHQASAFGNFCEAIQTQYNTDSNAIWYFF